MRPSAPPKTSFDSPEEAFDAFRSALYARNQELACDILYDNPTMNVNQIEERGGYEAEGLAPLHYAAWKGQEMVFADLLQSPGVNVNVRDYSRAKPLHYAIDKNLKIAFDALLGHRKINVNTRDGLGRTPLELAMIRENAYCAESLLSHHKLDINGHDSSGRTYFDAALAKYSEGGSMERMAMYIRIATRIAQNYGFDTDILSNGKSVAGIVGDAPEGKGFNAHLGVIRGIIQKKIELQSLKLPPPADVAAPTAAPRSAETQTPATGLSVVMDDNRRRNTLAKPQSAVAPTSASSATSIDHSKGERTT